MVAVSSPTITQAVTAARASLVLLVKFIVGTNKWNSYYLGNGTPTTVCVANTYSPAITVKHRKLPVNMKLPCGYLVMILRQPWPKA